MSSASFMASYEAIPNGATTPEWLYPYGETGELLTPYIDRVVTLPLSFEMQDEDDVPTQDQFDASVAALRQDSLTETSQIWFTTIAGTVAADPKLQDETGINWSGASFALLDRTEQTSDFTERRDTLTSALVASLFCNDPGARLDFIEKVQEMGLSNDIWGLSARLRGHRMAILLDGYTDIDPRGRYESHPGVHLQTKQSIQKLSDFTQVFRLPPDVIAEYAVLARRNVEAPAESAHRILRKTIAAYAAESMIATPYDLANTTAASIKPLYVDQWVFDPYKIQRAALLNIFVTDMTAELFPEGDRTPLETELARLRDTKDNTLPALARDITTAVTNLSKGVTARYTGYEYTLGDVLKTEQRHAKIYAQMYQRGRQMYELMHYIDPTVSPAAHVTGNPEIYSLATLTPLPNHAACHMYRLRQEARQRPDDFEDTSLFDAIMMKLPALRQRATTTFNTEQTTVAVNRGHESVTVPEETALASKETGVRLACTALRVLVKRPASTMPDVSDSQLDLISTLYEVMVLEAAGRGLLEPAVQPQPRALAIQP